MLRKSLSIAVINKASAASLLSSLLSGMGLDNPYISKISESVKGLHLNNLLLDPSNFILSLFCKDFIVM